MIIAMIAIILGAVGLDQLTKWLAVTYLKGNPSFPIWKEVLHLTYAKNEGAAFGMLAEHRWVFMVVSTVAIIGIGVYLFGFCKEKNFVKVCLAMVVGGGIGNMIDRVWLGYVVDFIDFTLIDFAIFNVADSFVTVGCFALIGYFVADFVREVKAEAAKRAEETEEKNDESTPS